MMRCLPWPLAVLCWLDNRYGPHEDTAGPWCRVHDAVHAAAARVSSWRTA
jgi:hypothetical protein